MILIPIIAAAWFSVLIFAVALCRSAAQGDRDMERARRRPSTRGTSRDPALSPRDASLPIGTISRHRLAH